MTKKTEPIFTVIITTYNRKDLLPRAINSVLNQTFWDFELIVVDNGSTDDTIETVKAIRDERICLVVNPRPTISCDAPRNIGIKIAAGKYVSFLDDDDVWYPEKLEKVKKAFDINPPISAVCHYEKRVTNGIPDGILYHGPWTEDFYERLLYDKNCLSPSAMTIKTEVLRRLNGFDERDGFLEVSDYDLWIRMAKEGIKFHIIPEALGEFHLTGRNCSMVNPFFAAKQARLIRRHILSYEKNGLFGMPKRGMWRLFQLYAIAGQSFFRAGRYSNAFLYFCKSAFFIIRRPTLVFDLFSKIKENG